MVKVRKYKVNVESLKKLLKEKKKESNLTTKQIAQKLGISLTQVEHYFRGDGSFAIPDAEIWNDLKELLKIETEKFDASIMEFIEKENVFESANRCYFEDGIAPTLTNDCGTDNYIVSEKQMHI